MEQHDSFQEISPEVGVLDEDAFADALRDDPDDTLTLLAELTGATDEKLRELARLLVVWLWMLFALVHLAARESAACAIVEPITVGNSISIEVSKPSRQRALVVMYHRLKISRLATGQSPISHSVS